MEDISTATIVWFCTSSTSYICTKITLLFFLSIYILTGGRAGSWAAYELNLLTPNTHDNPSFPLESNSFLPSKVCAVTEVLCLSNTKQLKPYLAYYTKFLPNLSAIVSPLNILLRKVGSWEINNRRHLANKSSTFGIGYTYLM